MSLFPEHRSLAPTAAVKRKITKTILQMSLDHHIVTPLTAMVIENEAGDECMLADSPLQDHSCCSGESPYLEKKYSSRFSYPAARSSIPSLLSPSLARLHIPILCPSIGHPSILGVLHPIQVTFLPVDFGDSLSLPSSNVFAHLSSKEILKICVLPSHII